jgi:hypothetical protein
MYGKRMAWAFTWTSPPWTLQFVTALPNRSMTITSPRASHPPAQFRVRRTTSRVRRTDDAKPRRANDAAAGANTSRP